MLIDRAPEPEFSASAFHDDLIQIPNVAVACLPSARAARGPESEFGRPSTDCLIGQDHTALEQPIFNFT
jgi:hypothetical protein